MPEINNAHGLRAGAQLVACFALLAGGAVLFPLTVPALFTVRGWWDLVTVGAVLGLVPLSVASLFSPRFVGWAVLTCWIILTSHYTVSFVQSGETPRFDLVGLSLSLLALAPLGVSALLFYASAMPRGEIARRAMGRKVTPGTRKGA